MPRFMKMIAAFTAALFLTVCGASAAQHQHKLAPAFSVPAIVGPVGTLAKSEATERIVVAQNGRRAKRGAKKRGARRGAGRRAVRRGGGARRSNRRRRRRNGAAAGAAAAIIGLGIAGAIASQSQADDGRRYCRRLRWRCDDGERWACRRFYRDC